jgi:hypothetical protein
MEDELNIMTKDQLGDVCRNNNITNFSRLPKKELLAHILAAGLSNLKIDESISSKKGKKSDETKKKTSKVKKETSPEDKKTKRQIITKLDRLLVKHLVSDNTIDSGIETLFKKSSSSDEIEKLSKKNTLAPFNDIIKEFMNDISFDVAKHYVDTYGGVDLVFEFCKETKSADIKKFTTKQDLYVALSQYLFTKDDKVTDALVKKVKQLLNKKVKDEKKKVETPLKKKNINESEEPPASDSD